jgi:hypothetical protein
MRTRKFVVPVLAAAAALLVALPAAALGSSSRNASNSVRYPDSTGEDAAAPDITSTVVSNDDAGLITFQINVSNRPSFTQDMLLDIPLDTDNNKRTGDPQADGAEYDIELQPGVVALFKWSGSDYGSSVAAPSLVYSYTAAGATIKIKASDLGDVKEFHFFSDLTSGITLDAQGKPDFTNAHDDASPDPGHATFDYKVQTKLSLQFVSLKGAPFPAKAGKLFAVGLAANESDTAGPVKSGTVACTASIAARHVASKVAVVANGVAVCEWKIPPTAKGKTIRGSVSLSVQGTKLSRGFSAPIH